MSNPKISEEVINLLDNQDELTLAKWWVELNSWRWPEQIPNPESAENRKGGRRSAIMGEIERRIGHKKCNRQWNIDRMTDEEHEAFWGDR